LYFICLACHAERYRYNARKRRKNPVDSFSGIPAIVLGREQELLRGEMLRL
jgi:hypothetical protein